MMQQSSSVSSSQQQDEELRRATAMAIAIQNNPKMSMDEIQRLVKQQTHAQQYQNSLDHQLQQQHAAAAAAKKKSTFRFDGSRLKATLGAVSTKSIMSLSTSSHGSSTTASASASATTAAAAAATSSTATSAAASSSASSMTTPPPTTTTAAAAAVVSTSTNAEEAEGTSPTDKEKKKSDAGHRFKVTFGKDSVSPAVAATATVDTTSVNLSSKRTPPTSPVKVGEKTATATFSGLTATTASTVASGTVLSTNSKVNAAAASIMMPAHSQQQQQQQQQQQPPLRRRPSAPIRLTGIAWKRRGGMGKYSSSGSWERRRIELQGTRILYYAKDESDRAVELEDEAALALSPAAGVVLDPLSGHSSHSHVSKSSAAATPSGVIELEEGVSVTKQSNWFESAFASTVTAAAVLTNSGGSGGSAGAGAGDDISSPRGSLDLAKEKANVHAALGHGGAPSPFCISIKVRGETKWKFCFDHHRTQMEWLAALTDVVVQTSVDMYNTQLLEAADPSSLAASLSLTQSHAATFTPSPSSYTAAAGGPAGSSLFVADPLNYMYSQATNVMASTGLSSSIALPNNNNNNNNSSSSSNAPFSNSMNINTNSNTSGYNNNNNNNTSNSASGIASVVKSPPGTRLWQTQCYSISSLQPPDEEDDEEENSQENNNNNDDEEDDMATESESMLEDTTTTTTTTMLVVNNNNNNNSKGAPSVLAPLSSSSDDDEQQQQHKAWHSVALEESETCQVIPQESFLYLFLLLNAAMGVARLSQLARDQFWYLVVFCNAMLFLGLVQTQPESTSALSLLLQAVVVAQQQQQQQTSPTDVPTNTANAATTAAAGTKKNKSSKDVSGNATTTTTGTATTSSTTATTTNANTNSTSGTATKGTSHQSKLAAASKNYKPVAGTTTMKIKNPTDLPVNDKNEVFAGWRCPPGDGLAVRSHGYMTTNKKIPSPGELFECVQCDIFEAPVRYDDIAPKVHLPDVRFEDDDKDDTGNAATKTWRTPDLFIITIALPTDPPKLTGRSAEGGGYMIVMYFRMKRETRQILRRVTAEDYDPSQEQQGGGGGGDDPQKSKVNAVRLLEEWIRRAPTDPKWFSRFKCIPNAHNLKEIGMPSWIAKYNGKPFLIKRPGVTGFIQQHPELSCFEFDISLHPFPFVARQGICFLKESFFKKVLVSFGFVIEGRADDELPECVIGVMQLCYPDPAHAIQAKDWFGGTAPKSFQLSSSSNNNSNDQTQQQNNTTEDQQQNNTMETSTTKQPKQSQQQPGEPNTVM